MISRLGFPKSNSMQSCRAVALIASGVSVQCFDGLQFDHKHVIDQQVHEIIANQDVFVVHLCALVLYRRQAARTSYADAFSQTFSRTPPQAY